MNMLVSKSACENIMYFSHLTYNNIAKLKNKSRGQIEFTSGLVIS